MNQGTRCGHIIAVDQQKRMNGSVREIGTTKLKKLLILGFRLFANISKAMINQRLKVDRPPSYFGLLMTFNILDLDSGARKIQKRKKRTQKARFYYCNNTIKVKLTQVNYSDPQ